MRLFFQSAAGAFVGKLLASIFIAVCVGLGFGPQEWARFVLGDLPYFGQIAARIAFIVLGLGVLLLLVWPQFSGANRITFQWPVARRVNKALDPQRARRVFHFRSDVQFYLDDLMIKIVLSLFNGTDQSLSVASMTGSISIDGVTNPLIPPQLETPRKTGSPPFSRFSISLIQPVTRETAQFISDRLASGQSVTLNLMNLFPRCRCEPSGDSFISRIWQGIVCRKKEKDIDVGEVVYVGLNERSNGGESE
jgi:hypothetical protein